MFAPKTKFPSFGAALPFPSTIITNYCFSAILKQQSIPHSLTTASSLFLPRKQNLRVLSWAQNFRFLAPLYPFPSTIITNYCFSAILLQRSIPHSLTTASSFVVMFAPKTKFTSFGAALPFPSTIITNYCFSAILKKCLNLSSSSTAVNTSQLDNCQ